MSERCSPDTKQAYEVARHIIGYLEGNCGLSFLDVKQDDWDSITRLVASLTAQAATQQEPVGYFCFVSAPPDDGEPVRIRAWTTSKERAESLGAAIGRTLEPLYRHAAQPPAKSLCDYTDAEIATEHGWRMQRALGDPRVCVGMPMSSTDRGSK